MKNICLVSLLAIIIQGLCHGSAFSSIQKAGILISDESQKDSVFVDAFQSAGYRTAPITYDDICDSEVLSGYDLLVIPDASRLPYHSIKPIENFLKSNKPAIFMRVPAWRDLLIKHNGKWISQSEYSRLMCIEPVADSIAIDWKKLDALSKPVHSVGGDGSKTSMSVIKDPAVYGSALEVKTDKLINWDLISVPEINDPFPGNNTITIFCAKGSKHTDKLSVEWTLDNGTRWIATVPLTETWSKYALRPSDFGRWYVGDASDSIADPFDPHRAVKVSVGLSFSHTGKSPGPHEYAISDIGTIPFTDSIADLMKPQTPMIDMISTELKFYNIKNSYNLKIRNDQGIAFGIDLPASVISMSPFPRAKGTGIDKNRMSRWIPIASSYTKSGELQGSPVSVMINHSDAGKYGIFVSLSVQDKNWYYTPEALELIRQIAAKINNGVFLSEGGTEHYTYYDDGVIKFGARLMNIGNAARDLKLRAYIKDAKGSKLAAQEWLLKLNAGQTVDLSEHLNEYISIPEKCTASVEVYQSGRLIDRVQHPVSVWHPAKRKNWVTVDSGRFMLNGKRWRIHGVNYWPTFSMASENPKIDSRFFTNAAYDPDEIERDLRMIKKLGFNAVATAFMIDEMNNQNILDFLQRCKKYNIKVMLHVGLYINPMTENWSNVLDVIKKYRFAENDSIFAYDLCWELSYGTYDQRRKWDSEWENWIIERYGSIQLAEIDWGRTVPRDDKGNVTGPGDADILNNKPPSPVVSAYRRFLDTLTYRRYKDAAVALKQVAPNQLVSFRMTESGNPTWRTAGMCYDFPYFAGNMDFLGPEGWGRIGDKDWVKHALFEKPYAKWAAPSLPLVWTEVGVSQLMGTGDTKPTPELAQMQADYYEDWYKEVLLKGGGDGIFWWWFPGGYRYGERTDYGVIDPDGSDRPVTGVIRKYGRSFINGRDMKSPDSYIEFNRNETAASVADMYDRIKNEFWSIIEQGKTPGFKTPGTGTTSAACPLTAVGGTVLNSSNPPEYLDGMFNSVTISDGTGAAIDVKRGGRISVPSGRKITADIEAFNLGESEWLHGDAYGSVRLTVKGDAENFVSLNNSVGRHKSVLMTEVVISENGINEPVDVVIFFNTVEHLGFGEKFSFTLVPNAK